MENDGVYIANIESLSYRNFKGVENISFLTDDNDIYPWTIFLGNNGTGKTNLLKIISSFESEVERDIREEGHTISIIHLPISLVEDHSYASKLIYNSREYLWESEYSINGSSMRYHDNEKFPGILIYAYGVNRKSSKNSKISSKEKIANNKTLFNSNVSLLDLDEWLLQTDYAVKNGQKSAERRLELIREVITGEIFPEITNFRFETNEELSNYVEFETAEGWFQLKNLAYGYQSTLSWIIDFCKKMFDRYPDSLNPLKEPAIVLIDEIDLHLHPSWQRSITKILSNLFPNTQFIATTHSPLVVQSLEEANVYVLNKDVDGVSVSRMPNKTFVGWSIEDILNKVMGLESKVKSDEYLDLMEKFDRGLDNGDYNQSKEAFDKLMDILPEEDIQKRVLSMQIQQFPEAR
ncbi:AAA family ATPase [Dokdonia donghaensis]|uniref:ATPase AAA-type core domain-containing protein n=1 Tax=Dokdonia donghaensis DSW-1 TaxID=1300343 RepID=A0A0A2GTU8_9FLAO|nr:AAA family ATPase [Dokdonia donghaensis]ANH60828.1 DNA replication and repair protein RecF [Dokdonia donghaensis DSW-1]KGO05913.1 hypothetical protein NV36_03015 [Dokdonia donghaensis DSW-1]